MNSIDSQPAVRTRLAQEGVAFPGEIASAATRHGLDPRLLAAVAAQETGGPGSNAGANIVGDGGHGRGLFQIDDRWHAFAKTAAAMDPAKNADYAAGMLSKLLQRYGGDAHKALSAYNAGSPNATGTLTQWGDGRKLGYADSVLRHYARLGAATATTATAPLASAQSSADAQSLMDEILGEIQQVNQLQSLSQSSPSGSASTQSTGQQLQIPSYAQMAGIDSSGHTKNDTSWAGIIDSTDDSSP
jgi:hypothetical protein